MAGEIVKLIEQVRPDVVVLEGVHLGRNVQTLITLAEFRGRLLQLCDMRSTSVITVTSPQLMAYLGLKPGTSRERKKERSQFTATALIHGQVYATDGDNPLIDHNAADAVCLLMVAEAKLNLARMVIESEAK